MDFFDEICNQIEDSYCNHNVIRGYLSKSEEQVRLEDKLRYSILRNNDIEKKIINKKHFFQPYDSFTDFRNTFISVPLTFLLCLSAAINSLFTMIMELVKFTLHFFTGEINKSGIELIRAVIAPFDALFAVFKGCFDLVTTLVLLITRSISSVGEKIGLVPPIDEMEFNDNIDNEFINDGFL